TPLALAGSFGLFSSPGGSVKPPWRAGPPRHRGGSAGGGWPSVALLELRRPDPRRPPLGCVVVALQSLVARADILRHGGVEAALVLVHLAREPVRLPALEDFPAVGIGDVFLRRADHGVGELPAAARLVEEARLLQPTEIDVVVQQCDQVLEAAVILLTLVRRGGQEQERLTVVVGADLLGQAVVERLFHLARGVI